MKEKNLRALVALTLIPGLGARRISSIAKVYPETASIFSLRKKQIQNIEGIGEASCLGIINFDRWNEVDRILEETRKYQSEILGISDPEYPEMLKSIYDPPALLWVKGDKHILNNPGIAIVGTRRPTGYGRKLTTEFTRGLVAQGLVVFSGLAYGVDAIAHKQCIDEEGKTVAVLGSGIDNIYPRRNCGLADLILESGGAVVSEYPPGTNPDAGNFPVRNRIVSGLSMGVLVIESGIKGGSMITAGVGLDQNREVFAIPHTLDNTWGAGCNFLIKAGHAKLVQCLEDVLEELPIVQKKSSAISKEAEEPYWKSIKLDHVSEEVCAILENHPSQIDELAERLELHTSQLLSPLLQLEMKKIIRQKAGKVFELV